MRVSIYYFCATSSLLLLAACDPVRSISGRVGALPCCAASAARADGEQPQPIAGVTVIQRCPRSLEVLGKTDSAGRFRYSSVGWWEPECSLELSDARGQYRVRTLRVTDLCEGHALSNCHVLQLSVDMAREPASCVVAVASELSPREKVVRLLEVGIGGANPAAIAELISPGYTQHNPRVVDGPQGLLGFVENFRSKPANERPTVHVIRTLVDGDFVVAHAEYRRHGFVAAFDVFRVDPADKKLVEHWDAGQSEPSGHRMIQGATEIVDRNSTEPNKLWVRQFVEEVLVQHHLDALASYFEGDRYIEHDPTRSDGVVQLRAALSNTDATRPDVLSHDEVKRVLGEGNFVLVQSRGRIGDDLAVIYDLYRVEFGKLAEHWSVYERVPSHPANANGMW